LVLAANPSAPVAAVLKTLEAPLSFPTAVAALLADCALADIARSKSEVDLEASPPAFVKLLRSASAARTPELSTAMLNDVVFWSAMFDTSFRFAEGCVDLAKRTGFKSLDVFEEFRPALARDGHQSKSGFDRLVVQCRRPGRAWDPLVPYAIE
jgi:hypothetical protein